MKKIILRLALATTLIYGALVGYFYLNQSNLLYAPFPDKVYTENSPLSDMREVNYSTPDGLDLYGWYFDGHVGAPLVVYFHGNTGDLLYQQMAARGIIDEGYNLLLVEYRGFGGNPGTINEAGLMVDARTALGFATAQGWNSQNIILWGRSLGTGVALRMGNEGAYKAIILEAPYTTIPDVAAYHYPYLPTHWLLKDRYDSASLIKDIHEPVFIYHGDKDKVVPAYFSAKLAALGGSNVERRVIEGLDHANIFPMGGNLLAFRFLKKLY